MMTKLVAFVYILYSFILLDGDKSPPAVLALTQITFFFFITNPA